MERVVMEDEVQNGMEVIENAVIRELRTTKAKESKGEEESEKLNHQQEKMFSLHMRR